MNILEDPSSWNREGHGVQGDSPSNGSVASPQFSHVLVIDDDVPRRSAMMCKALRAGARSVSGTAIEECRAVAASLRPRLIIVFSSPGGHLRPELVGVLEEHAGAEVLLIGVEPPDHLAAFAAPEPARLHALGSEPSSRELCDFLDRHPGAGTWPGPFTPAEYVQLAGLGGHSVALHCVDRDGAALGCILMVNGRVRMARHEALRGFEAFAALITHPNARVTLGDVFEHEADDALKGHWQALVLEAMRRHDEGRRNTPRPAVTAESTRESDFSGLLGDPPSSPQREALTRAASIPALPVTEMREALGSTRGSSRPDVRMLVEEGVRAVIDQDYPRAVHYLERALLADPNNTSVRHRLDRLYAIIEAKR